MYVLIVYVAMATAQPAMFHSFYSGLTPQDCATKRLVVLADLKKKYPIVQANCVAGAK